MPRTGPDQLSPEITFDVKPHPALSKVGGGVMAASLKISGSLGLKADLQAGDVLTVTVADADGLVVTEGLIEVGSPGFKTLTLQGEPFGTERIHKAKVTT
jgi:hypothetical protein